MADERVLRRRLGAELRDDGTWQPLVPSPSAVARGVDAVIAGASPVTITAHSVGGLRAISAVIRGCPRRQGAGSRAR